MILSKKIIARLSSGLIIIAISGYSYLSVREQLIEAEYDAFKVSSDKLRAEVDHWLSVRKNEITMIATSPAVRTMDWQVAGPYLKGLRSSLPNAYIFALISPDGSYYNTSVNKAKANLADRAHVKAALAGNSYASDPVVSRTLGTDIVAITTPIRQETKPEGKIIGVLGQMINTTTLKQLIADFKFGPNSYAYAINSGGISMAHPDKELMGNINNKKIDLKDPKYGKVSLITNASLKNPTKIIEVNDALSKASLISSASIKEAAWNVITVADKGYVTRNIIYFDVAASAFVVFLLAIVAVIWRATQNEASRLRLLRNLAEEQSQQKTAFMAKVSHELRTPLNSIIGYSDLLTREISNQGQISQVKAIGVSGRHLLSLINSIIDMAKVETQQLKITNNITSISKIAEASRAILEPIALENMVGLEVVDNTSPDTLIEIDEPKVRQIVINLATNALKHSRGSKVSVVFAENKLSKPSPNQKRDISITVTDDGRGMTQDQLELALQPFQQLEGASSGSGLGLPITKSLAELLGGTLKGEAHPNQGTQFTVEITNIAVADASDKTNNEAALEKIKDKKFLVVDDNAANRNVITDLLASSDITNITAAASADDAITILDKVDFVICDIQMPIHDGFWFLNEAKKREYNGDILMASAYVDEQVIARTESSNASGLISKPFTAEELMTKILSLSASKDTTKTDSETNQKISSLAEITLSLINLPETSNLQPEVISQFISKLEEINRSKDIGELETFAAEYQELIEKINATAVFQEATENMSFSFITELLNEVANQQKTKT
jgi:signal transduction histidine kinase/DNA-binding NarL/FixJ family response regulator